MTAPLLFPPGQITPLGDARMQAGVVPQFTVVGTTGTKFYLSGGKAPSLSTEDGFALTGTPSGMQATPVLLDEQGARQDGITNLDTVFDPAMIKLPLEASGVTAASLRKTIRVWLSEWNPPNVLTLSCFTQQMGMWWMTVRQSGPIPDELEQDPSLHRRFAFTWKCRGDNAFWQGPDSVSTFQTNQGSGWCPLTNLGTRPGWPRFLCIAGDQDGAKFTLGNGAVPTTTGTISNSGSPITFGPLKAGQIAAIYTNPRLRSVVDLSPTQPAQSLTEFQQLIQTMVNSAVGNYPVPPELQALESVFGILPPQGPMYSLLNGRFTYLSQLPAKQDGYPPQTTQIPVSISNGNSNTKIVAAVTPYRTWPW